jgi:hypothetical protein
MNRVYYLSSLAAALIMALGAGQVRGGQEAGDSEFDMLQAAFKLRVGDTQGVCSNKLAPIWESVPSGTFFNQPQFKTLIPFSDAACVTEFKYGKPDWQGWPKILFLLHSDPAKTNLVDALLFNGWSVKPIVEGKYQGSLDSIKKGDSFTLIFRLLGEKQCDYFLDEHGVWRVRVIYYGTGGAFMQITGDAATGIVSDVRDVGIL